MLSISKSPRSSKSSKSPSSKSSCSKSPHSKSPHSKSPHSKSPKRSLKHEDDYLSLKDKKKITSKNTMKKILFYKEKKNALKHKYKFGKNHPLDNNKVRDYLKLFEDIEQRKSAEFLLYNTIHISWNQFQKDLIKHNKKLINNLVKNDIYFYIFLSESVKKSMSYFAVFIFLKLKLNKLKNFLGFTSVGNKDIQSPHILYIDDLSYSGSQFESIIKDLNIVYGSFNFTHQSSFEQFNLPINIILQDLNLYKDKILKNLSKLSLENYNGYIIINYLSIKKISSRNEHLLMDYREIKNIKIYNNIIFSDIYVIYNKNNTKFLTILENLADLGKFFKVHPDIEFNIINFNEGRKLGLLIDCNIYLDKNEIINKNLLQIYYGIPYITNISKNLLEKTNNNKIIKLITDYKPPDLLPSIESLIRLLMKLDKIKEPKKRIEKINEPLKININKKYECSIFKSKIPNIYQFIFFISNQLNVLNKEAFPFISIEDFQLALQGDKITISDIIENFLSDNSIVKNCSIVWFDHKLAAPVSTISPILGCGIAVIYDPNDNKFTLHANGSLLKNCPLKEEISVKQKIKFLNFINKFYSIPINNYNKNPNYANQSFSVQHPKYDPQTDEDACIYCPRPFYKLFNE
jgi:hypothetical protein